MSIIKINAITVPADSGDELGQRFAARRDSMAGTEGFEGFELLKPTDDRTTWLVITRWADEESFESWRTSQDFQKSHSGAESGSGEPPKKPVGMSAELWSYTTSVTG